MTHRSRSGGPAKAKVKKSQSKEGPRKLHHPPTITTPAAHLPNPALNHYLTTPTDSEILQLIREALKDSLSSPTFLNVVQQIKSLLFERKWLEVFEDPALLEVYAGRWVPSRACCFRSLIGRCEDIMRDVFGVALDEDDGSQPEEDESDEDEEDQDPAESSTSPRHILSLGGGAGSELLALASLIAASTTSGKGKGKAKSHYTYTALDIGAWSTVLSKFHTTLQTIPPFQIPLQTLSTHYTRTNLLTDPTSLLSSLKDRPPNLITLLFTLSELFQQSRQATLTLLHNLTRNTAAGTYFLVADSASDIGEFEMGSSGRKWPVFMLLDMVLKGMGGWEVVEGEDSRWYRLEEGVGSAWVVKLENTRYWYRVYRRIKIS